MHILLVEDDSAVAASSLDGLTALGFTVEHVTTGGAALAAVGSPRPPDVVLLDLGLPDMDGQEVCRRIRSGSETPIIVVSARGDEADRVIALELGADDYLVKPFSPRELVARVRAILRRTNGVDAPLVSELRLGGGNLVINSLTREVLVRGSVVDLTRNEYRLLEVLARYPGRVYSRLELINRVQGYDYEGYERTIDAHVKNLRKKIEVDARHPEFVETVFGSGYRMARPARAS